LRDELLATRKRLADSKVATESASYAKQEMETQYQKYANLVYF